MSLIAAGTGAAPAPVPIETAPIATTAIAKNIAGVRSISQEMETTSLSCTGKVRTPYIACVPLRMAFRMNISRWEIKKALFTKNKMENFSTSKLKHLTTRLKTTYNQNENDIQKKKALIGIIEIILNENAINHNITKGEFYKLNLIHSSFHSKEKTEPSEVVSLMTGGFPNCSYTGTNKIAYFLSGGLEIEGISVENIIKYTGKELEEGHRYIQFLFPINTESKYNLKANLVDDETIALYASDPVLRADHLGIFNYMLGFFELTLDNNGEVIPLRDFESPGANVPVWLKKENHNQLRLTRIMHSLNLLGNREAAMALQKEIVRLGELFNINTMTLEHWKGSVNIMI